MKKYFLITAIIIPLFAACSSLTLKPVNFGWPLENVLKSDASGIVEEQRHSLIFNVTPLFKTEFGDSADADSKEIRLIRNNEGYYFITAMGFKNVYMFSAENSSLNLEKSFFVINEGMQNPVLNQRNTYIELIEGESIYEITSKGIVKR